MIIDTHVHAYPDWLAAKALQKLKNDELTPLYDATINGLINQMDKCGVDKSILLNIATNVHQMHSVNDFAASINNPRIIPFGSVYPTAPDVLDELDRIKSLGMQGVKFHPEYQNFFVDADFMRPIYKKISSLGLVTVFHAGYDVAFKPPYHCTPERAIKVLSMMDSPVIFAHWGGLDFPEEVLQYLAGTDAYIDLSMGYNYISLDMAQKIIDKHSKDRLLFASDGPWHSPEKEKVFLNNLRISKDDLEKIYHKNIEKLIKI